MNTNPMIGVFECNMKDLENNKGYYTTPLSPVSVPMFGSIQVHISLQSLNRSMLNPSRKTVVQPSSLFHLQI